MGFPSFFSWSPLSYFILSTPLHVMGKMVPGNFPLVRPLHNTPSQRDKALRPIPQNGTEKSCIGQKLNSLPWIMVNGPLVLSWCALVRPYWLFKASISLVSDLFWKFSSCAAWLFTIFNSIS